MTKKKIICINQYPLNPRTKRLSYVETFQRTGITFEYWDMTEYFSLSKTNVDGKENAEYVKTYSTLQDVKIALNGIDCPHSFFFIGVPERFEFRKFFKLLSKHHCRVLRVNACANTLQIPKNTIDVLRFLLSPKKVLAYIKRKLFLIYCKINKIQYFDIFSSSRIDYRTISVNHPDYDDYNKKCDNDENKPIITEPYAVFYDSYFPLHPDFKYIHKLKIQVDFQHYLNTMNKFFDYLENKYSLKVVIAAHPSSHYGENDFNGREIIKWRTCELTIGAKLIINQSSNSTSFAVLANKPIAFISCNDIENCNYLSKYILTLSQYLGKKKYNIDTDNYDDILISKIDEDLRQRYIYTYLTDHGIDKLSNDDIFYNYILSNQ